VIERISPTASRLSCDSAPANEQLSTVKTSIFAWKHGQGAVAQDDWLACEEPLEIRVRGRSVAVIMRTPGHDAELAAGFLVSEGVVTERRQIVEFAPSVTGEDALWGNVLNAFLTADVDVNFSELTRHVFASSSCGLCGKASIESVHLHFPPVRDELMIDAETIRGLPEKLWSAQSLFQTTGGLHAAALFDPIGELIVAREDVGRHNAVDKVIGFGFLSGKWPFSQQVLLVSGRASFEILQKALAARIPIVAAVSAPSSLAVEFAEASGQTLIGFLRSDRMNVYTHPKTIQGLAAGS